MNDGAEIAGRLARLAHVGDHGDLHEYRELYADDATWAYTGDPVRGVDAIIANARSGRERGRVGPDSGVRHVITTVSVRVTGEREAASECYVLVYTTSTTPPELRSIVRYLDSWQQDEEGWRITSRLVATA